MPNYFHRLKPAVLKIQKELYLKEQKFKDALLEILQYFNTQMRGDVPVTIEELIGHIKNDPHLLKEIEIHSETLDKTIETIKESYKELAIESIDSYEDSTKKMQNIADKQQEHIQSIEKEQDTIDLDLIKEQFSSIQEHMYKEIERANAQIVHLKEKVKMLEEKSNLDPLTKTFNRRVLASYLKNLTQKKHLKKELHLLMIDIDNFKQINDKYGHIAGDKILIFIAHTLKKTLREGDKVFRYGGEEFVVILNRIDTQSCIKIANRIIQLINTNTLIYKNNTIQVTVSAGGTKFIPGDTPEKILERADKALYEAKRTGKNKFISYEGM